MAARTRRGHCNSFQKIINSNFLVVDFRGLIPNQKKSNIFFQVEAFTKTDGQLKNPVLSLIDTYQKPNSKEFQNLFSIGELDPHCGSYDWKKVCYVSLNFLQLAHSGKQKITVKVSLLSKQNNGFQTLATHKHQLNITNSQLGYLEEDEDTLKAREKIIQLAVATAYSDSEYHPREIQAINNWIQKTIKPYQSSQKIITDTRLRKALKDAENASLQGLLEIDGILDDLRKTGNKYLFYEALELVIEVMASDGIEHEFETQLINMISNILLIEQEELEKIKNQKIGKLTSPLLSKKKKNI